MDKKAVCLLSGGLDSCVTISIAKDEGYTCYALSFNYGQTHNIELDCAKAIAQHLGINDHIIFHLNLAQFGGSALVDKQQSIPQPEYSKIGNQIPSTYVPARNTIFLSIALAYAETVEATQVFIGANALDYSGYPDCRPEYFLAFQQMANVATKQAVSGNPVKILTPLLSLTKAEIIKIGSEVKAPLHLTWSCYNGEDQACGHCESCQLRLKGFQQAGIKDPIEYAKYPQWYRKI